MKNKIYQILLAGASIVITSVPVQAARSIGDLGISTDIQALAIIEDKAPEIPNGSGYSVTELNIRSGPSSDSPVVGKYKKGDSVAVQETEGEWAKTDKGYVWGGYLSNEPPVGLNIKSDSENASKYIGHAYDIISKLDEKYINILSEYSICVSDNSDISISNDVPDHVQSPGEIIDGYTYLSNAAAGDKHLMYYRANSTLENTIYHELGHAIDYKDFRMLSDDQTVTLSRETELPALREKYELKDENVADNSEYFAEMFRISLQDPEGLKETAPVIFDFIENIKSNI